MFPNADVLDNVELEESDVNESSELSGEILYNDLSRREVRSLIFHLLYAMEGFDYQTELESIVDNFNRGFELNIPIDSEVFRVACKVIAQREKLDEVIIPLLA